MQKCGVMSRAVKFLTQAFSIQAQKNTNKNVTHILTEQLSLSLHFQQRVHEQACPCVLLSLSSWLGRFPSKTKANNFARYMRNEGWRACFFLHSSLNLISKGYPTDNRQIFSLKTHAGGEKYKRNVDSYIFPQLLSKPTEVSGEFLKCTQRPPKLCVHVPPGERRGIQISPKEKIPKCLVLVWADGKGKLGQPKFT